jgi:transcriptional regulator with XRE-family HTH domain
MTLGEKIREVRRKCGFSQEQLADKMSVSRSAIAKWETDKGLPDVGNLKILARLLNVSVDYLLDETEESENPVIRETYQLADYGYGCGRVKKDRVVREKFPDAPSIRCLGSRRLRAW